MMCTDLSLSSRLEQTAEECAELAKACLKLSRIYRKENPTPVTESDALENFMEEVADIGTCLIALDYDLKFDMGELAERMNEKFDRWNKRLEESTHGN